MTDPNLTTTEDPEAACKHFTVKRSKVGNIALWRCQEAACQKLFSLQPFKVSVIPPPMK